MSQESSVHNCVSYPCPVCATTFPDASQFVQPQLQLWTPDEVQPVNETVGERTASRGEIENLATILNEMEANLKRKASVSDLVTEAQDIVERIRNDRL
jgi:hypothetical protein